MKKKNLHYNGIIFDEWSEYADDDGNVTYWANICPNCAEKAKYTNYEEWFNLRQSRGTLPNTANAKTQTNNG